jgi:hypothetical protein
MKILSLPCALALLLAGASSLAAEPAPAAASAAAARVPAPRPLAPPTPPRDGGTDRADLRPERPVEPQIVIPLGRTPPTLPVSKAAAQRRSRAAATGGIDDAAARCEAQADPAARARCREQFSREARARRN